MNILKEAVYRAVHGEGGLVFIHGESRACYTRVPIVPNNATILDSNTIDSYDTQEETNKNDLTLFF